MLVNQQVMDQQTQQSNSSTAQQQSILNEKEEPILNEKEEQSILNEKEQNKSSIEKDCTVNIEDYQHVPEKKPISRLQIIKDFIWSPKTEYIRFVISGSIGTGLFYAFYELLHFLYPHIFRTENARASVSWGVSYFISIMWQHALHR